MSDIQFKDDDISFNCRAIGICVKENKIFLSKMKNDVNWSFVGGKVRIGESTEEAILREYKEEIGVDLQIDKLLAVIENFFDLQGQSWHQYIFFYQLRDDNHVLKFFEGERQVKDEKNAVYKWVDLFEIDTVPVKPDCSREILQSLSQGIQHYVNREE